MECLGGNGYVEESGLPRLYREAPLNSIWEGSGNVNALDVLRALAREPAAVEALLAEVDLARGADARLDAAERLQDQRLAEHDRGVRLLDADRPHVDGPALARAACPAEGEHAVARPHVGAGAHEVQQLTRVRRVGERVVTAGASLLSQVR